MYERLKKSIGLTGNQLKIIAMISMLIDHIGAVLYPQIVWLRILGRLSFPIFAFLLVEGFYHTHDLRGYEIRLLTFAFLSEIPFDLAFYHRIFFGGHQNIFFTLFLGLLLLDCVQNARKQSYKLLGTLAVYLLCWFGKTDYSIVGITFILLFYLFYSRTFEKLSLFALTDIVSYGITNIQSFAALAVIPIGLYNGEQGKGGKKWKYGFYLFYPLHLMVLYVISRF